MPLNKDTDLNSIRFRVERALVRNWVIIAALFLAVSIWGVVEISEQTKIMAEMKAVQEKELNSAIAITDSGTLVGVEKFEISPLEQQNVIASALLRLVTDRVRLTNGWKQSKFESAADLIENDENLKLFIDEYILVSNGKTEENAKLEQVGVGYFRGYMDSLLDLIQRNKLPHMVSVLEHEVVKDSFKVTGQSFKIAVKARLAIQTYGGTNEKNEAVWIPGTGDEIIEAEGYIDIKTRTKRDEATGKGGYNKSGLHFVRLKVTIPVAGDKKW